MATITRIDTVSTAQPIRRFQLICTLECLPDCDEVLPGVKPRYLIQIAANIKTYRANRRRISQAESHRVRIVIDEVMQIDRAVHVAAIVENDSAEGLHDPQRKPHFGIQNKQLLPAHRDRDVYASRLSLQNIAEGDKPLRASCVDRKATQRSAAAGKEKLAGRHKATRKLRRQAHADAVGENDRVKRLILRDLAKQFCEIRARTERGWRDSKIDGGEYPLVRVEGLIAGVMNERA